MPNTRPRLLVLTSTYPRWSGDTEPRFIHHLSHQLTKNFDVHVLAPHFKGAERSEVMDGVQVNRYRYQIESLEVLVNDGGLLSNLKANPFKWLLMPGFLLAQVFAIRSHAKRLKPDFIHVHWIITQGLCYLVADILFTLPPMIITSHGGDLFALRGKIATYLKLKVLGRATKITVVSTPMKQYLVSEGITEEKIAVAPMGVDFADAFSHIQEQPCDNMQIVFVGRLVEKKGLEYLIKAMPEVLEKHGKANVVIIGEGPRKKNLQQVAQELDVSASVSFLGARSPQEVARYYRESALFVAPFITAESGDQEGLGLVTIEAMGSGLPVLVGNVAAVKDISGLLHEEIINPKDTAGFAAAISRVFSDYNKYKLRAVHRAGEVRHTYSWSAIGEKYSLLVFAQLEERAIQAGRVKQ